MTNDTNKIRLYIEKNNEREQILKIIQKQKANK